MSEKLLKSLVEEIPEVESALIIDEDGIVVYKYEGKGGSIDPEELSTQLVNPVKTCEEVFHDLTSGSEELEETIVFTRNYAVFVYRLVNETFLFVVARRTPLYGRTRFKIRSRLPEIIKAL